MLQNINISNIFQIYISSFLFIKEASKKWCEKKVLLFPQKYFNIDNK